MTDFLPPVVMQLRADASSVLQTFGKVDQATDATVAKTKAAAAQATAAETEAQGRYDAAKDAEAAAAKRAQAADAELQDTRQKYGASSAEAAAAERRLSDAQSAEAAAAARTKSAESDLTTATSTRKDAEKDAAAAAESSSSRTSAALGGMAQAGKVATAVIGGGLITAGVAGTKMAETYQTSMARVQAAGSLTTAQAKQIGDTFLATAGSSTMSGKQIADAFSGVAGVVRQLGGGTLTSASAMDVMKAAMAGSESSGKDLGDTTKTLVSVMQAYGLSTGQAADTMNTMWNTSKATGIGMDNLSTSVARMKTRLGAAAPDLDTTSTLLVDLAQHGVTGQRGLNSVSSGMTTLMGGSKATDAELKNLGVTVFDSSGKFVGMQSVISQLQPKLAGMSQQQQIAAEKALFGASAANTLSQVISGGTASWDKASKAVAQHGSVEAAAEAKTHTLAGETETLKSTAGDLATKFGQALIPMLTKVAGATLTVVNFFEKHQAAAKALAAVIGGVLSVAMLAYGSHLVQSAAQSLKWIGDLKDLQIVQKASAAAQWLMNAAMDANPIGIVIVAVAALVAALIWFFTQTKLGKQIWQDMCQAIQVAWQAVTSWVTAAFQTTVGWFQDRLDDVTGFFRTAGNDISNAWNSVVSFFGSIPDRIRGFFAGIGTWLVDAGRNLIQGLINGITSMIGSIGSTIGNIASKITGGFASLLGIHSPSTVFEGFGENTGQGYINGIKSKTADAISAVKSLVSIPSAGVVTVAGVQSVSAAASSGGSRSLSNGDVQALVEAFRQGAPQQGVTINNQFKQVQASPSKITQEISWAAARGLGMAA